MRSKSHFRNMKKDIASWFEELQMTDHCKLFRWLQAEPNNTWFQQKYHPFFTEKVQIPHRISELEEMALYQQDQKWLEEVKQVGGKAWRTKMSLEYQNDLQGKKVRDLWSMLNISLQFRVYLEFTSSLPLYIVEIYQEYFNLVSNMKFCA